MTFDLIPVQDNSHRAVGIVALFCPCSNNGRYRGCILQDEDDLTDFTSPLRT